jgi:transcriptional regulator with XRE-family HTH domain
VRRFGEILRQLRKEKDMTQEQLGKVFDVKKSTVAGWEAGNRFPGEGVLIAMANYFAVPTDYLLGLLDTKNIRLVTKSELLKFLPTDVVLKNKMSFLIDEEDLSEKAKKEIVEILRREGYFK